MDNHDNQRGHGSGKSQIFQLLSNFSILNFSGGDQILNYKDDYKYKLASGFMMAQPYGFKRIMSSYDFYDTDQGPPGSPPNSYNSGSCGNGWICEHRWAPIMNMAKV